MVQLFSPVYHLPSQKPSWATWCGDKLESAYDFGQRRYRILESKNHKIKIIDDTSSLLPSYAECALKILLLPLSLLLLPAKLVKHMRHEYTHIQTPLTESPIEKSEIQNLAQKVKAVGQMKLSEESIDQKMIEQGKVVAEKLAKTFKENSLVKGSGEGGDPSAQDLFQNEFYSSLPELFSYLQSQVQAIVDDENPDPLEHKATLDQFRSIFLALYSMKTSEQQSEILEKYKTYLKHEKDPHVAIESDHYPHYYFTRDLGRELSVEKQEAKYIKGMIHLFSSYRKQCKLIRSKDPKLAKVSDHMRALMKLSIFHGTKTSTLRFMESTDLRIIPSGWLHNLNARVVSGELDTGAQFNGVNHKGSSWATEEILKRSIAYGSENKFKAVSKSELLNFQIDHLDGSDLLNHLESSIHALRMNYMNYCLWNGDDREVNAYISRLIGSIKDKFNFDAMAQGERCEFDKQTSYIIGEVTLLEKSLDSPMQQLSDLERFFITNQRFLLFASSYPLGSYSKGKVFDNEMIVRKAVRLDGDIHALFVGNRQDITSVNRALERHGLKGRVKVYHKKNLDDLQEKFQTFMPKFKDIFSLKKMEQISYTQGS